MWQCTAGLIICGLASFAYFFCIYRLWFLCQMASFMERSYWKGQPWLNVFRTICMPAGENADKWRISRSIARTIVTLKSSVVHACWVLCIIYSNILSRNGIFIYNHIPTLVERCRYVIENRKYTLASRIKIIVSGTHFVVSMHIFIICL